MTGTLESFGRDEIQEIIREQGGNVSSSVSSKTDFVIVGKNPGSKKDDAEKIGVPLVSEDEFKQRIQ